jgi:hypothetical protein
MGTAIVNVEANFFAKMPAPMPLPLVVTDVDAALEMPEFETFWFVATDAEPIRQCGRIGMKLALPRSTSDAQRETLVVWINSEGRDIDTVLTASRSVSGKPIPARRSRAGFHASITDLGGASA